MDKKKENEQISQWLLSRFKSARPHSNQVNFKDMPTVDNIAGLLRLNYSVHARKVGNVQIRFRVPDPSDPKKKRSKQITLVTDTKSKSEATKKASYYIAKWAYSHSGETSLPITSIRAEVERFIRLKFEYRKPRTRQEVILALEKLLAATGVTEVAELTKGVVEASVAAMKGDLNNKSWRNILLIIKRFIKFEIAEENLAKDPTVNIPVPPKSSLGKTQEKWAPEEFEITKKYLDQEDRDILDTLRWTGMYPSDLYNLQNKHFVVDSEGYIKIYKLREKAKPGSEDEYINIPVFSEILEMLKERVRATSGPDERVFPMKYKNAGIFTDMFLRRIKLARKKAGLPIRVVESIRHTFASYWLDKGIPTWVVRMWLGHSKDSRVLEDRYNITDSTGKWMDPKKRPLT